jgi:hypothetical protein
MTLNHLLGEEPNALVAKAKRALAKKLSLTRMGSLFGLVEIGWYLAALDRAEETCALLEEVTDTIAFTGDYNIWTPVGEAICLSARCTPSAARRKQLLARLVKNPALGKIGSREHLKMVLGHSSQLIEQARAARAKTACTLIAQGLQGLSAFEQTAGLGFSYDAWLDRKGLTEEINHALAELKCRLA